MFEEIKELGLESLARDSGLLSDKGVVRTNASSIKIPPTTEESVVVAGGLPVDESASYSPAKRGRAKSRSSSGRRGKARRSKSGSQNPAVVNATKGLRHFSLAVCNKVRDKGVTTYNEVADELVAEFEDEDGRADEKNIRRRVYDALNVLAAMDIIRKEKKEIIWHGLPSNASVEVNAMEEEIASRCERIAKKEEHLSELKTQLQLYKSVIDRNAKRPLPSEEKLTLPFIIVNTNNRSKIDLHVSADRTEYSFDFSHPFEIHDDPQVLQWILRGPEEEDPPHQHDE